MGEQRDKECLMEEAAQESIDYGPNTSCMNNCDTSHCKNWGASDFPIDAVLALIYGLWWLLSIKWRLLCRLYLL